MSAGTIVLTNGSDAVTGTGTAFTTDLVAGDFVVATVGGITYTLPVKAVGSDTALTLTNKYTGPTQANLAWNVVPRATQNQVTAELVAQVTQALRGQNYDKANWQAVFSASGDITVLLPDGSTFNGPSWNKISELLADIDPVALQALADQVNANAQQVAIDRLDVDEKAAQAQADAQTASNAAGGAVAANAAAQQAKTDALAAKASAEAARDAAQQANPDNQLKKANNLSDVANAVTARSNIGAAGAVNLASFIRGLDVSITASGITVGVGAFALPDGSVTQVTAALTAAFPMLTANTWYHLYLYSNNVPAVVLEVSTTAPVAYAYPAHQKTGDATRRYIGSFRTSPSNAAFTQTLQNGQCIYQSSWDDNGRVLAGGTATDFVAISLVGRVPVTAFEFRAALPNTASSGAAVIYPRNNNDAYTVSIAPGSKIVADFAIQSYPNTYYKYISTPSGGSGFYVDVGGYKYAR